MPHAHAVRPDLKLMSLPEVAATLHVSIDTIRDLVRDGRLRTVRLGRQQRITTAALLEFVGIVAATAEQGSQSHPASTVFLPEHKNERINVTVVERQRKPETKKGHRR